MNKYFEHIPFPELEQFLLDRGFMRPEKKMPGSKEIRYAKGFPDQDVFIQVVTSFETNKQQRGYGEDAIRCQLISRWERDLPLMDLSATKRMTNWENTLGFKLKTLENFIDTKRPCPICGSDTLPIHGQFEDEVLWVCETRYPNKECSGLVKIGKEQQIKIAAIWPRQK